MGSFSLRQRLALALLGLSVGVAGLLAGAVWASHLWLESATLDRILGHELAVYLEAGTVPQNLSREATGMRLYRPARAPQRPPPPALARLAPGSYRDFGIGNEHFHVLVRDITPGDRVWLTYDVNAFESREEWIRWVLLGGVLLAALVSWLLSGWLARRTLRPLDGLVTRIARLNPEDRERLPARADHGELSVIVSALNERMSTIEELITRERAFAAAAAHELRTPLTAIRIAAEMLAARSEVPREPLARIERAVSAASQDLDALLTLARGRETPPAQPLRLHELLPMLAEPYTAAAQSNGTRLAWQLEPVTARLAPGTLGIIFTNLLRNALRAAPQGEVRVELSNGRLAVADNGEGIPAGELPRIFEPGTHGKNGGSGIGLYISRVLAQRCGWQLTLTSELGRGTCAELKFSAEATAGSGCPGACPENE